MTTVILTWELLFLHDHCYSRLHDDCYSYITTVVPAYMTTVILIWRLLFQKLHDDCYSYMMTVIPEARPLHLDIPIWLISIDQHWRGGFNLFNPTQSILNNLGIGRFAHLREGMSYFYAPWIHPGFYDSLDPKSDYCILILVCLGLLANQIVPDDSMCSFWVEANLCRVLSFIYMHCCWGFSCREGGLGSH
jgi:hypothetical protein